MPMLVVLYSYVVWPMWQIITAFNAPKELSANPFVGCSSQIATTLRQGMVPILMILGILLAMHLMAYVAPLRPAAKSDSLSIVG